MKKKYYRIEHGDTLLGIYRGEDEDHAVSGMDLRITELWVGVTLGSDGMGNDASEEDFDSYCAFVEQEIGERVGFEVALEFAPFGKPGREPHGQDREAVEAVEEALSDLWEEWCEK